MTCIPSFEYPTELYDSVGLWHDIWYFHIMRFISTKDFVSDHHTTINRKTYATFKTVLHSKNSMKAILFIRSEKRRLRTLKHRKIPSWVRVGDVIKYNDVIGFMDVGVIIKYSTVGNRCLIPRMVAMMGGNDAQSMDNMALFNETNRFGWQEDRLFLHQYPSTTYYMHMLNSRKITVDPTFWQYHITHSISPKLKIQEYKLHVEGPIQEDDTSSWMYNRGRSLFVYGITYISCVVAWYSIGINHMSSHDQKLMNSIGVTSHNLIINQQALKGKNLA